MEVEKEGREVEAVIVVICQLSFRRRLQVGKFLQGNLIKQNRTLTRGSAELDFFVNVPKMPSSMNAVYNLIESETLISSIPIVVSRWSHLTWSQNCKVAAYNSQKHNAWIGI